LFATRANPLPTLTLTAEPVPLNVFPWITGAPVPVTPSPEIVHPVIVGAAVPPSTTAPPLFPANTHPVINGEALPLSTTPLPLLPWSTLLRIVGDTSVHITPFVLQRSRAPSITELVSEPAR
jgi:hypothetical protein